MIQRRERLGPVLEAPLPIGIRGEVATQVLEGRLSPDLGSRLNI